MLCRTQLGNAVVFSSASWGPYPQDSMAARCIRVAATRSFLPVRISPYKYKSADETLPGVMPRKRKF